MRLLFACLVIVTHSYALTGMGKRDWLGWRTNGQIVFSYIGLYGFFTISGYLIFQSLTNSKSLTEYFRKRILRIYPGLIVAVVVSVFICSLISPLGFKGYFLNSSPYTYILSQLSLFESYQTTIQGIFANNNAHVINGSLWTIGYEVLFYILISVLFFFSSKLKRVILILCFITLSVGFYYMIYFKVNDVTIPYTVLSLLGIFHFGSFFLAGSLLACFKIDLLKWKFMVVVIAFFLCILAAYFNILVWVKIILFPMIFIPFGLMCTKVLSDFSSKSGDISYGVYIYGFFIQQILLHFFKLSYIQLLFISLPISLICGFVSWHLIEKKALKYKSNCMHPINHQK